MRGEQAVTAFALFERISEGLVMPDHARIVLGLAPTLPSTVPVPGRHDHSGDAVSLHVEAGASLTVVAVDHPAHVAVSTPGRVRVADRADVRPSVRRPAGAPVAKGDRTYDHRAHPVDPDQISGIPPDGVMISRR
jgi:hypothetical protein